MDDKKPDLVGSENRSAFARILAMASTLFAFAIATRMLIWGTGERGPLRETARLAGFARHDLLTIAGFSAFGLILLLLAAQIGRGQKTARITVWVSYFVLGIMMAINVVAIEVVGAPISRKLLVLADWFRSFTPISAIKSVMSAENVIALVLTVAALLVLPRLLAPIWERVLRRRIGLVITTFGALAMLGWYSSLTPIIGPTRSLARIENPTVVLVRSLIRRPALDIGDYEPVENIEGRELAAIPLGDAPPPKNIIIVILESTGADVAYGQSQVKDAGLTPNLTALASEGVRFTQAYAPVSASTTAGVALISGRYLGFPPVTDIEPLPRETLATVLAGSGWDTAYLMSGDLDFQGVRPYLRARGFDRLEDLTADSCDTGMAVDDRCTVDALGRWLDTNTAEYRFAVLWTGQAHYPYHDPDMSGTSAEAVLDRYQRAVRYSDEMLGKLVADLRERGILDETLLVITGDHGEAFNEHGFQLHANSAYIEEVRVPLIMRHPRLPGGASFSRTASTIDIGATVLALADVDGGLGQGFNLLAAGRERPAFSAVFSDAPMLSYRIGGVATLLHLQDGRIERFDLARDPCELAPRLLKGQSRERALAIFARLARDAEAAAR